MILREYPQWLVSGSNKIPISPKTGAAADVRDRALYVSYDEAVAYATPRGMDIGFVLTPDDPFVVIDLDAAEQPEVVEVQKRIYEKFETYAELSRSRKGVHIWCRGTVPRGVRRDKIEIYPAQRYMIFTGLVLKDLPVNDCQPLLDQLFREMDRQGYTDIELKDVDAVASDEEVFTTAMRAVNGDKFDKLCRGDWQGDYPSQSEADYALMNMLCFYTRSNEQAMRLFRYSALGKRAKAQRDEYLLRMIKKIRSEDVSDLIDFSALTPPGDVPEDKTDCEKEAIVAPPGFMGDIARYIYDTSIRPVPEVAVASAIALCAGICGRQFNVSGTGLNQYVILLAKTGVGKEDGARGIERILKGVRETVPAVDTFYGPGTFASGQSIIRTLDSQPCLFAILGEFGLTLQELSDTNGNSVSRNMRRVLLDLYSKSGKASVVNPSVYSDSTKNTKNLYAPALTLFGESTPETFYEGLSLHHVESGLIPRFLIIEYTGERTDKNPNAFEMPTRELVGRFADFAEMCLRMQANHAWADVTLSPEAQAVLDAFDTECDERIRGGGSDGIRQLWNRAHLKALKLAALCAVVDRPHNPVISEQEAQWALAMVRRDISGLTTRFESGDVGDGDAKQIADLERILQEYVRRPTRELVKYGVTEEMKRHRWIPMTYLQRRLIPLSSYRKDRRGGITALHENIRLCESMGKLVKVPARNVALTLNSTQIMFYVV